MVQQQPQPKVKNAKRIVIDLCGDNEEEDDNTRLDDVIVLRGDNEFGYDEAESDDDEEDEEKYVANFQAKSTRTSYQRQMREELEHVRVMGALGESDRKCV